MDNKQPRVSPFERALLRKPGEGRPKGLADHQFKSRDGLEVRPGTSVDDAGNGGAVESSIAGEFANAAPAHLRAHVQRKSSRDFGRVVVARGIRPSDTQLVWGETRWARAHAPSLLTLVGSFGTPMSGAHGMLIGGIYSHVGEGVFSVFETYTPNNGLETWPEVRQFVIDAATLAAPQTVYTAQRLLTVSAPYVIWCRQSRGLPLSFDVIFSRQVIELYVQADRRKRVAPGGRQLSDGSRRNYRSMLLRISEVLVPEDNPAPMTALNARTSEPPYDAATMSAHQRWALGQSTALRVQKATTMLALCAGAGLRSSEIGELTVGDLTIDDAGVLVTVRGRFPRSVPLLAQWESWLVRAIEGRGEAEPVWGNPGRMQSRNMLSGFTAQSDGNPPRSDRLRATWLVTHLAAGTPMKELLRASGVEKFENLTRYLEHIPGLDTAAYRTLLRLELNR